MIQAISTTLFLCCGLVFADAPNAYRQDFESSDIGTVPKGWTVTRTGEGDGSAWKVVEDKTAPKGAKVLAQVAESPSSMFNLCVADEAKFKDVEVSVSFRSVKGATDQGGGIVWRYTDANHYYVARYNPLESNFRLYHVVAGKRTKLVGKEEFKLASGQWHTLTIKMIGDAITCSINGKVELEAKDATFPYAGKVGLWTKADAQTYFDDFTAKEAGK
jgi:hypothetical protein